MISLGNELEEFDEGECTILVICMCIYTVYLYRAGN